MPRRTRETPIPRHGEQLRRDICEYITAHPAQPLKARALARALLVPEDEYAAFRDLLRALLDEGALQLGPGRTLRPPAAHAAQLSGIFRSTRRGFGFVEIPGRPDLFVPRGAVNGALDGDRVAVRLARHLHPSRAVAPHAEVTRIIERALIRWVGVLERRGARFVVLPQGRAAAPLVNVDDPGAKGARPGELVVVEPLEHTLDGPHVRGVILERLGPPSQARTQIRGVIRRYHIPEEFPAGARSAAQQAAAGFDAERIERREDLRALLTITIDPDDARDFDDAISIEPLADGCLRLGVHIADVSHFVRQGDALDQSARERGNSVYFPGFVVPMLPELLSNEICSLQPGQVRFTKSAFITYDRDGRVRSERCANTVIRSHARLTYRQASAALDGNVADVTPDVAALLRRADELARRIRRRRLDEGMLVLNLPEVEICLDDAGEPADAAPADTSFSHTIIEMFMVEANETVSRTLRAAGQGHLRRIHPPPPEDGAPELARLLASLELPAPRKLTRAALRKLLDETRDRPEAPAVNLALLRTLAKASYSPDDVEHFALASTDYCHFTSPIRRYPDLVNHRLLDGVIAQSESGRRGRRRAADALPRDADLAALGAHTSFTERRAQSAEREARQRLLLMVMSRHLGQTFEGLITGFTPAGAFVQIRRFLADGFLSVERLPGRGWEYDRERSVVCDATRTHVLRVGSVVEVVVASVDLARQEMALSPTQTFLQTALRKRVMSPQGCRAEPVPSPRGRRKKRGHQGP